MITQRAARGRSRATPGVLEPDAEARVREPGPHALAMLPGVLVAVEVELRDRLLHDAPHRLAPVRYAPHQPQRRKAPAAAGLAPVALEQPLVARLVQGV